MPVIQETKLLSELKSRIKGAFLNIKEKKITQDAIVINGTHTIYFEIKNEDYLIKGIAIKRLAK
jgi:hypothetical protein